MEDDYSARKDVPVTIKSISQQILLSGLSGRKAPSSMGKISTAEVLRLRATSAVSRDKSVRRSAQDDDFVGVFDEKHPKVSAPAMTHTPKGSRQGMLHRPGT